METMILKVFLCYYVICVALRLITLFTISDREELNYCEAYFCVFGVDMPIYLFIAINLLRIVLVDSLDIISTINIMLVIKGKSWVEIMNEIEEEGS